MWWHMARMHGKSRHNSIISQYVGWWHLSEEDLINKKIDAFIHTSRRIHKTPCFWKSKVNTIARVVIDFPFPSKRSVHTHPASLSTGNKTNRPHTTSFNKSKHKVSLDKIRRSCEHSSVCAAKMLCKQSSTMNSGSL